jgi:hypothetical protein
MADIFGRSGKTLGNGGLIVIDEGGIFSKGKMKWHECQLNEVIVGLYIVFPVCI